MNQVETYAQLGVSEHSEAYSSLLAEAAKEAASASLVLTGAGQAGDARQPTVLTPAMASWYSRVVAGPRSAAIADLRQAIQSDSRGDGHGNGHGMFLEHERDTARQKFTARSIADSARFTDKHGTLVKDNASRKEAFAKIRNRLGREPVRRSAIIYVICLLGIVLLEAFINFESFMRVPYITSPFLATGATLSVGLGIGFAAHFHGLVLRQWAFLSSPQEAAEHGHAERKRDAIRRLLIGSLLLSIALTMVGGSRYYYLLDYIIQAQITGEDPPSMFGGIIFMLLSNIVAYVVGALVSYALHDPHPIYAEQDRELRKSDKLVLKLRNARAQEQQKLRDGLETELKEIANQETRSRGPNYPALREQAGRIVNKDQEVIGALLSYRATLLQTLGRQAERPMFRYPDGTHEQLLPTQGEMLLTGDEYAALSLSLGFDTGSR